MPAAKKTAKSVRKPAKKTRTKKPVAKKVAVTKVSKAKATKPAITGITKARKAAMVVGKVMKNVKGSAPKASALFGELEALAKYIQDAKQEIAALSPDQVKDDFLPTASDELDAIINATADATNAIMDSTEIIEEVMSGLKGVPADQLMVATTSIYEACGFQDITGQRITKVVSTLKSIEDKVDGLLDVFSDGSTAGRKKATRKTKSQTKKEITDEDLLNGPQATDQAKSQAEIDALLASFD
jgi:chemotaxis protein CheZ